MIDNVLLTLKQKHITADHRKQYHVHVRILFFVSFYFQKRGSRSTLNTPLQHPEAS